MTERWSVTDSPWFWLATFSAMAVVGLFVVGPKYAVREASWEQKLLTRGGIQRPQDQAAAERGGGETLAPADINSANTGETPVPPNLLVPLWRLKIVAAVAWLIACVMLWRQLRQRRADQQGPP
jgi:hypothetical protein